MLHTERTDRSRRTGLLVHLSVTSSLEMEIPPEQQQVLTLTVTMPTNMSPRHCPWSGSDDRCVCTECLSTVPVLPRPTLSRVLTLLKFAQAAGPFSSLPVRHHLTAVFKNLCQRRRCVLSLWSFCVYPSVYTFASMILVFATSSGVVTNAAIAPAKDTFTHLVR